MLLPTNNNNKMAEEKCMVEDCDCGHCSDCLKDAREKLCKDDDEEEEEEEEEEEDYYGVAPTNPSELLRWTNIKRNDAKMAELHAIYGQVFVPERLVSNPRASGKGDKRTKRDLEENPNEIEERSPRSIRPKLVNTDFGTTMTVAQELLELTCPLGCGWLTFPKSLLNALSDVRDHCKSSKICLQLQLDPSLTKVEVNPRTKYEPRKFVFLISKAIYYRQRNIDRMARVAQGKLVCSKILNCPHCSWEEVQDKNSGQVLGAHKRVCAATVKSALREPNMILDDCNDPFSGEGYIEDEEFEIIEEDHDDFIVQIAHPFQQTAQATEKHKERMKILDSIRIQPDILFDVQDLLSANEFGVQEEEDSEVVIQDENEDSGLASKASLDVFLHQQGIEQILSNPFPDLKGGKNPEACVALLDLGLSMNVSVRNGDRLLAFLKEYTAGVFFTRWGGLKDAFNRQFKDICKLQQLEIPLPCEFFGTKDCEGNSLTPVSCFYYNILHRLGEACLEIDPEDFTTHFTNFDKVKGTEERIFNTFPKAKLFQRFCCWTKKTHGAKAACIVLSIYFDAALATSSTSMCPLVMFILNCTGVSFRPIFIGYCPIDLAYSDERLTKILQKQAKGTAKPAQRSCKYAIRFAKRQALQIFLTHVLSPILGTADRGIKLQIGSIKTQPNCVPLEIFSIVHLGNFLGDSAALHDLASVKIGCKDCRCRQCFCSNLACFGADNRNFSPRNSKLMYALASKLGEIELFKFRKSCGLPVETISEEEKALRQVTQRVGMKLGVIPGRNNVITLWEAAETAKVFYFYLALLLDYLHTLWKGICEYAASGVLQTVHCISRHCDKLQLPGKYTFGKANLDERLSRWTGLKESFHPVRLVHLQKVTDLLKADAKGGKASDKISGLISGNFPAWQMPNLCLQLIFGIGCEGAVIPNSSMLISEDVSKRHGNPTTICINALSSVLEVAYYCEANALTETQLKTMAEFIDTACLNLVHLHDLKTKLCQRTMPLTKKTSDAPFEHPKPPKPPKKYEMPRNIKTHSTTHFPNQIEEFGAFSGAINTALGEKSHQDNVGEAYGRSSRVLATSTAEMARHCLRKELAHRQMKFFTESKVTKGISSLSEGTLVRQGKAAEYDWQVVEDDDEELLPDARNGTVQMTFHAVGNLGSVDLIPTQDDSMLKPLDDEDQFLHPLLTRAELWGELCRAGSKDSWVKSLLKKWTQGFDPAHVKIRLFGGLKSDGDQETGVAPFYLRANRKYRGNARNRIKPCQVFNSFEINYEDSPKTFGKVLALVGFQDWAPPSCLPCVLPVPQGNLQLKLWVAVARYEKVSRTHGSTLPFETFKFEAGRRARLGIDFIEVNSVHRPCLMIISSDADPDKRFETKHNLLEMRWFCIPFDRAVKTDNSEYASYAKSFETAPGVSPFATQEVMKIMLREFDLHGKHDAQVTGLDPTTFLETGTVVAEEPPSEDDENSDDNTDEFDWNT